MWLEHVFDLLEIVIKGLVYQKIQMIYLLIYNM